MARREVVEVVCDRCSRTETQAPDSGPKTEGPEAKFMLHDAEVVYQDLCRRCRDTLGNYYSKIIKAKEEEEKKPPVKAVDTGKQTTAQAVKKGLFNRGKAAG